MENVLEPYGNRQTIWKRGISELEDRNLEMVQVEEEMLRLKKEREREIYESYSPHQREEGSIRMLGFQERENSGVGGVQSLFTEGRAENTQSLGEGLHIQCMRS